MLIKKEFVPLGYPEAQSLAEKFNNQPTLVMLKNNFREVRMIGPSGSKIIVGKSLRTRNHSHYETLPFNSPCDRPCYFLFWVLGSLLQLPSRMVRPITQMSATAELLSEKDLSKRLES